MLEPNMRRQMEDDPDFREARAANKDESQFVKDFESKYHLNPRTGEPV
jgi:hypothetical protein